MLAVTREIFRLNCGHVGQINYVVLIPLLYSSLLCIRQSISCSEDFESTQIKPEVIKQDQIDLKTLQEVSFNEIDRVHDRCSLAAQNLDSCSAQLIDITQSNMHNLEEINDVMCPKFKEIAACIKNNTECYKPFEKQVINWILSSTRRMNYKRCRNEGEKQKFLRLTQSCFANKNPVSKCMNSYIANLEAIADFDKFVDRLSENDIQIQLSCCANMRFKQCVMMNAKNYCRPMDSLRKLRRANSVSSQRVVHKYLQRSTFDMMADLEQMLDSMALTGPEFICQSVDESFCRAKFDGRFRARKPRHKSIVPAMISIYSDKPE